MSKVSVLIPSRNEKFLTRTVQGVLANAVGDVEVIVHTDEIPPDGFVDDDRVVYLHDAEPVGMREGIVRCAKRASGEYLMKLDAHCLLDNGFDVKLLRNYQPGWVMIPRRYRLDETKWSIKDPDPSPPVDYERFVFPLKYDPVSLHGFRWDERTLTRMHIPVDDTLSFQGSCWFMSKEHFVTHNLLTDPGYKGLPQQEAEEIGLTTWFAGGRVVVDKTTWYAHWYKGKTNGIGYYINKYEARRCYSYSYGHWVVDHKEQFIGLIERFWPLPGWPDDWRSRLYGKS